MPLLRDRLAGLAAARAPYRAEPGGPSSPAFPAPHRVWREACPLTSRRGLDHLPAVDPGAAARLARAPGHPLPPLDRWLFLDLETTGLAGGAGTYAFLVGTGQLAADRFCMQQFFLPDLGAEKALLLDLATRLEQADVLVTYNGKLFDLPVLETRFRLARLRFDFERFFHLDLLSPARRLWRHHGSLRLADLERRLFGYDRPRDVSGERIPRLYFDFLRSRDEQPLRNIFRHNVEDLVTLAGVAARLLRLVAQPESESCDPLEHYALGKLFERAQEPNRARALYERALGSGLPPEAAAAAGLRLSCLYKRQRDYRRAAALWRELAAGNGCSSQQPRLKALEELAITYEHRLDDPEGALEATHRGLREVASLFADGTESRARARRIHQRFARRLRRLTRRQPALTLSGL